MSENTASIKTRSCLTIRLVSSICGGLVISPISGFESEVEPPIETITYRVHVYKIAR